MFIRIVKVIDRRLHGEKILIGQVHVARWMKSCYSMTSSADIGRPGNKHLAQKAFYK